jgi:alpha-glucosidase
MVMGTRCHQLAMLVIYESALQVLCDSPYNYRKSPAGLNFLKIVPTTWDDTKVIHGRVGEYITIARRSGEDWYIGSMTNWDERELSIPLDFLADGKYTAHIWQDAPDADIQPQKLTEREIEVDKNSVIKAKMVPGGGHVVYIYKED